MAKNEPQSYGSQGEWVTGTTAQKVNPGNADPQFYDNRRESESSAPDQGGKVAAEQLAEPLENCDRPTEEGTPVQGVTDQPGGKRVGGYFKHRDYE